jgi:hypothetical protein
MPRRLKIPASETVKWHHSDITMAQRNDATIDEILSEVDRVSKARIVRHAAEEHTPQGIARKAAERERLKRARTTHNGKAPVHTEPEAKRKPRLLDEDHIEALREDADDDPKFGGYYPDSKVFGLTIFLGAREMVAQKDRENYERNVRQGEFETKIILSTSSSRYDPKTNRCYGEYFTHYYYNVTREVFRRSLYDMQIDELMATWEDNSGQKSGMVIDKYNRGKYPPGKDAAEAFINEMMSEAQ